LSAVVGHQDDVLVCVDRGCGEQTRTRISRYHIRFRPKGRVVDTVDIGAAELDRLGARRGHQEPDALVPLARLDVVSVLDADDLPGH
jgi:hypothetical protein